MLHCRLSRAWLLGWILLMMLPTGATPTGAAPPNASPRQAVEPAAVEKPGRRETDLSEAERPEAGRPPIVIAHRGASGYRPEHTLEAYRLAILQGADFIEPDLVVTRDGVLIARHENELSGTTDIATRPEFAARRTTKRIGGHEVTGWFSEDLTLEEIKTLRAKERIPDVRPRNARYDGKFTIPTLKEIIDLVRRMERETGRRVGIYPETKQPTWFAHEGWHLDPVTGKPGKPIHQSLGELLIETLVAERFTDPRRVYIQSFEVANLIELRMRIMPRAGVELPLIQLLGGLSNPPHGSSARPYDVAYHVRAAQGDPERLRRIYGALVDVLPGGLTEKTSYSDLVEEDVLAHLHRAYAAGLGPSKDTLLPRRRAEQPADANGDGVSQVTSQLTGHVHPLVARVRRVGLELHPYTLRAEERYLALDPRGEVRTIEQEVARWLELGATGFFIDQPDAGVRGRERFLNAQPNHSSGAAADQGRPAAKPSLRRSRNMPARGRARRRSRQAPPRVPRAHTNRSP